MGKSRGSRLRRLIGAAALATAVAAGPLAGPAAAADLDSFAGMGTGYALRVTLDVRPLINAVPALQGVLDTVWAAVPGQSGAFPGVIDQTFIKSTSDNAGDVTKSRSVLAEGLIDLESLEATQVGQSLEKIVQTLQLPSQSLPLITGAVGTLKAAVNSSNGVNGSGKLTNIGVGLPLDALTGDVLDDLLAQLQGVIDDLNLDLVDGLTPLLDGLTGDLVPQLTDTIDGLVGQLGAGNSLLGGLVDGLGLGTVSDLQDSGSVTSALTGLLDVDSLVGQITDMLDASLLEGALADLTGLVNITKAAQSGDGLAIADSVSQLKSLKVLGGLVDVGLLDLESHSQAAGTKGSAKNTSSCSIADVKIGGDALGISLDGTNIFVNGSPVPVVGELVGQVKGVVDQVLNTLGIDVGLCEVAQLEAEADGSAAAQRVSALRVEVAPLGLFHLVIDPTVETSVAAQPAVPAEPEEETPLAHTGAGALATLFSGLCLAGAAIFMRRKVLN